MKKRKALAVMAAAAFMMGSITLMAGCGNPKTEPDAAVVTEQEENASTEQQAAASYTVTFYDSDGETILNTQELEEGASLEEYLPEKEGYIFTGWYGTPQMTHLFDFNAPVSGDLKLFGGFVSYKEDTREFAIVGSGTSPVLLESNWGAVIGDPQKMVKEENDTENRYSITLDLNEGDEFQFAINSSWNAQRGYGYLDTITFDGKDYFQNAGSLGDASTKRSNMKCAVAGNYTFILTTYPGEDACETDNANYSEENKEAFNINPYDKITWTYNGAGSAEAADTQTNYYIKGAKITDWKDVYTDETGFVEENGIYTLKVKLVKGDEFMFTSLVTAAGESGVGTEYIRYTNISPDDTDSLSVVSTGGNGNMISEKDGTYTFVYDPSTKVMTVSCE